MSSIRLFAATLLFFASVVSAQTYVQINGLSVHSKPGYNGENYGLGIEHSVAKQWNIAAGFYRNSEYNYSGYAYGRWNGYRNGPWDLGIGVGLVTGYNRASVLPVAFPEACYKYLCSMFLPQLEPSSASVLGFHLKVPLK